MKTYTGIITKLEQNQIFVFGSNTQGRHGKGAALWAKTFAGAEYGNPIRLQGQSYAIVTKDLTKKIHPSIAKETIIFQINNLYKLANNTPNKEYLIAYSGKGVNLNGYSPKEMKEMFFNIQPPDNIIFEEEFSKL